MHPFFSHVLPILAKVDQIDFHSPVIWLICGLIYFLPSILGFTFRRDYLSTILIFNIGIGWTVLGWFLALYIVFAGRSFKENREFLLARQQEDSPRRAALPARLNAIAERLKPCPGFLKPVAFRKALASIPEAPPPQKHAATLLRFVPLLSPSPLAASLPATPEITWIERYPATQRVRIEYAESQRSYSTHTLTQTCLGVDTEGAEYLGGVEGKQFRTFRTDYILRARIRAA